MSANGPDLSQFGGTYNVFARSLVGAASRVGVNNYVIGPTIRQNPIRHVGRRYQRILNRLTLDAGVGYEVYGRLEFNRSRASTSTWSLSGHHPSTQP
jgi:hypothetical protein